MNQSSSLVDELVGITAKTVIKSLNPGSEHGLKQNLKVFIRKLPLPPYFEENWFLNHHSATYCLRMLNQRMNLLNKIIYYASEQPKKLLLHQI